MPGLAAVWRLGSNAMGIFTEGSLALGAEKLAVKDGYYIYVAISIYMHHNLAYVHLLL